MNCVKMVMGIPQNLERVGCVDSVVHKTTGYRNFAAQTIKRS